MLSVLIAIALAVMIIGGVAYAIFTYAPFIIDFWNSTTNLYYNLTQYFPDWLAPFVAVAVTLAVIGLLVKLL